MLKKPLFDPEHPPSSLRHACVTGTLLASLFVTPPLAAQTIVRNWADLDSNSTIEGSSFRLNRGSYEIDQDANGATVNMVNEAQDRLIVGEGVTFGVTGGSASDSAFASMGVAVEGGTLTAQGGSAQIAHGVNIDPSSVGVGSSGLTQTGGSIEATGGSGERAFGIRLGAGSNIMQSGGVINAKGGSGIGAFGIITNSDLTQAGGIINAEGGSGNDARGIHVGDGSGFGSILSQTGGTITATGGSSASADGIAVEGSFTQTGGTITATGGSVADAHGVNVFVDFTQSGGAITTTGGTAGAVGITMGGDFVQDSGTITATGGNGTSADGIAVDGYFTQSGGTIIATGGMAGAIGIAVNNDFTQSDGIITATGGSAQDAHGIMVNNDFTQDGGAITAIGSHTAEAHGIVVAGSFAQDGGTITAIGGSAQDAKGISVASGVTQAAGGIIDAIGGSGTGAYGINVDAGDASIGGMLNASSQGAASMSVSGNLKFEDTSTYSPEINLATGGHSGLVQAGGNIVIGDNPGVTLQPRVTGVIGQGSGSFSETILSSGGSITDNGFNLVGTASLKNTVFDPATGALTGTYVSPLDNIGSSTGPNTRALLGMMAGSSLTGGAQYDALDAIASGMANVSTDAEQRARALDAQLHLTPHGTTRMAHFSINQQDAVQKAFTDGIGALAQGQGSINGVKTASAPVETETRTDAGIAARPDSLVWMTPVYETGTRHARTGEFRKADQDFGGFSIGVARSLGDVTFGVQGHYLNGRLRSGGDPYYKAETDTFGITAGGRIDRLLPTYDVGYNSTWVQAVAGYSRESIDQTRSSYGMQHESSPDADIWRLGVSVGRDIAAGTGKISPEFGFDYTRVKMDGYTEGNNSNMLALHVSPDGFDSFRLKLGAAAELPVYDGLRLRGAAYYRYELMDRNMRLETAFAGAPTVTGFATTGERVSRSSGEAAVGLRYNATNNTAFGADYTIRLEDGYTGHQFGLNLAMKF